MIRRVKIGPITYQVRELNDLHTVNDDGKKQSLHGHIVWAEAEIRVANDQAQDVKIATIWHEAVHGILHNAGHDDHSEDMVIALGHGLMQLVRDNPELIELTVNGTTTTEHAESD